MGMSRPLFFCLDSLNNFVLFELYIVLTLHVFLNITPRYYTRQLGEDETSDYHQNLLHNLVTVGPL